MMINTNAAVVVAFVPLRDAFAGLMPALGGATEAQRQQVNDGFARYISAIYADRSTAMPGRNSK